MGITTKMFNTKSNFIKCVQRSASLALALILLLSGCMSMLCVTANAESVQAISEAFSDSCAECSTEIDTIKLFTGNRETDKTALERFRGTEVYLGGVPFGVKFMTEGAVIVGFCDVDCGGKKVNPASAAGLRLKDIVVGVNGAEIDSAEALSTAVAKSGGKPIVLNVKRGGQAMDIKITPVLSDGEGSFKAGIWVKDNGAGIGTVTFVTENGIFGGLGHGICDSDSGELIKMRSGIVTDVTVSGIVKGEAGAPGEIKGYFTSGKTGTLLGNTDCGVYGMLVKRPETISKKIKIGMRDELHEGDATVLCTLDDNTCGEYKIRITGIDTGAYGNKCFCIRVTDERLVERTGGIVQGMSGSPIIQDGKLVGAVTHVLINDSASGYGIFVENMLGQIGELAQ